MKLIYNIGVRLLYSFIYLASFFDSKSKAWINGQKEEINERIHSCIWIHCASLGEYKQALPIASLLTQSGHQIIFTFFSPSGFIHAKSEYPTYYLPLDTLGNAKKFIKKINPSLAIFVRSEYWYNYIIELDNREIPLVIINCYLDKDQYFFKWYAKWFHQKLQSIKYFYAINNKISQLLTDKGFTNSVLVGDTKVDQVLNVENNSNPIRIINENKKIILCASTEKGDHKIIENIIEYFAEEYVLVIVPHEHTHETFDFYNKISSKDLVKYSNLKNDSATLIYIDVFGVLSSLFKYAWVSYIGGGFDKGIHNILESCIVETPMIFGPRYNKFPEAQNLIDAKAAISIDDPMKILDALNYFKSKDNYDKATLACEQYITNNKGATKSIYNHMKKTGLI